MTGPPTRVFLVGYYGFANLGDETILEAVDRRASSFGARITHYAVRRPVADPRAVMLRGRGLPGYVRAIVRADTVVLGGGGILKDEGIVLPIELFLTALLARLARRPVALLAVGVGPIRTRFGGFLVGTIARLATVRTVRDADSARVLAGLGVHGSTVVADPVFTLESASPAPTDAPSGAPGPPSVVVSVRPWPPRRANPDDPTSAAIRAALGSAVSRLVEAGWSATFVALHAPRDAEEAARTITEAGLGGRAVVASDLDWAALDGHVRSASLVLAMRYHALVASALAGRPVVPIAYEPKVAALADALGLEAAPVIGPALAARLEAAVDAALVATAAGDPAAPRSDPASVARLRDLADEGLAAALSRPASSR